MPSEAMKQSIPAVAEIRNLTLHYGKTVGIDNISLDIPAGKLVGLIGPDGVGKSTLISLVTGSHAMQQGELRVLGGDMRDRDHREAVCPQIAYMPQGLGRNLYFTLTVEENLQFFASLFGQGPQERRQRIDRLTKSTGLYKFLDRPAGKLSGGMKQKLGLCCSLIHDPDLLVLDEPTTGVDPLARRQFWDLIDSIRKERPHLSVLVATAYMDEAQRFNWLIAMNEGRILDTGTPQELLEKTHSNDLDSAFIRLLPEEKRKGHHDLTVPPLQTEGEISIEAQGLTKRFGDFTAVDHVSFSIRKGEIFGFLGSNGCGKTTTMRMLTGLSPATEGTAKLFGRVMDGNCLEDRKRLGYMTQLFSLYNELSVRQNLRLYATLYDIPENQVEKSVDEMLKRFDLEGVADRLPSQLPLGIKQRMSLAAAVIHHPQILILDEPTSGVDPVARDTFWELIIELSRRDKVTVFITTHFMNEAARCDRISLMHAGRSLACDTPQALIEARKAATLEDAFIGYLEDADSGASEAAEAASDNSLVNAEEKTAAPGWFSKNVFDFGRFNTCFKRELLELGRDKIRTTLALFGAMILLVVIGYGINLDVENIKFAVFDSDQSQLSMDYASGFRHSRYFKERPPVHSYEELDERMKAGELDLVVDLPPGFGQKVQSGRTPDVAFWINGDEPGTAETTSGYVEGQDILWQQKQLRKITQPVTFSKVSIQNRYRYNPDVLSLPAIAPAVIPLLLMMIPAVLAALSVVREKEQGSIINLYVTPVRRSEFLLGKQLPYVLFAFASAVLLILMAVFFFNVPLKGNSVFLLLSIFIYCIISTGMGLLCSSVTKSQIAVIFLTMVATLLPATLLCGMTNPVPNDGSAACFIGHVYPTTYMLLICRGVFNKGLGFLALNNYLVILVVESVIICGLGILFQRKQER